MHDLTIPICSLEDTRNPLADMYDMFCKRSKEDKFGVTTPDDATPHMKTTI